MRLEQYRTTWGILDATDGQLAKSPVHTFEEAAKAIKELGYDGMEIPLKQCLFFGVDHVKRVLETYELKCTIMIFTDDVVCPGAGVLWGGPYEGFTAPTKPGERDKAKLVATHLAVFKESVVAAQEFRPTLVISHTLKDFFTHDMAAEFFTEALRWEEENNYIVCHETHRRRFLHSPWVARDFLPQFPQMKICADLSHWCCVAETSPDDPDLTQVIEDMAPMVYHVHCRVGYDHGPQVPDPRAPEWLAYTEGHERWWDTIWKAQLARGQLVSTMIAEHGPPNYQPTIPYTKEPTALIWDVNLWIQLRRQARFQELFGSSGWSITSGLIASSTQAAAPITSPGESILAGQSERVGFLGDAEASMKDETKTPLASALTCWNEDNIKLKSPGDSVIIHGAKDAAHAAFKAYFDGRAPPSQGTVRSVEAKVEEPNAEGETSVTLNLSEIYQQYQETLVVSAHAEEGRYTVRLVEPADSTGNEFDIKVYDWFAR